ncbi:FHA domain-containing protein [Solilutibacter pythonis]|uniref:FHA domain-containing protein n=1 Tax=Solilutibacter pythonis TaxID=2483112 RepID=UPI001B86315A|nr:FHA domain-containing protein [Lysobacter pythonis]
MNTHPEPQPVLRFPGHAHSDLPLRRGMNGLCRDPDFDRGLLLASPGGRSLIDFCFDARGLWLHVAEGVHSVHVNGRPVQHLAFLRLGDGIHCEGVEMRLVDRESRARRELPPSEEDERRSGHRPLLLRGLCGRDHGRAFPLDQLVRVGGRNATIRLDGADETVAELFQQSGKVWLSAAEPLGRVRVNDEPVAVACLRPGDQLGFAGGERYVLDVPGRAAERGVAPPAQKRKMPDPASDTAAAAPRWRIPWLLVAAVASAAALAALLWFGVR